jgi:Rrf2 family transcriptional regulator, nitric oxide-sensitive transcriptional repressor
MLPKTAEYALRAFVWLSRAPEQPESADRLARATQVPRRYLHRVLQDLVRAGLVRSQPGPGGGYACNRDPREVTILDVVNAVGSIERMDRCPLGLKSHTTLCPLHRELDNAYATLERAFARVTVGELARAGGSVPPLCELAEAATSRGA